MFFYCVVTYVQSSVYVFHRVSPLFKPGSLKDEKRMNNFKGANTGRMLPAFPFSQSFILRKGDINVWAPFTLFFLRYKHTLQLKKTICFYLNRINHISHLTKQHVFLYQNRIHSSFYCRIFSFSAVMEYNYTSFLCQALVFKIEQKTLRTALNVGSTQC